ncbi:MAG: hypothetical protein JSR31_15430 [Nitrospira sp.]|nr:hypothetical protein [Nitrospira sp.]
MVFSTAPERHSSNVVRFHGITTPPLGAALVKAGRHAEVEKVYRKNLRLFPGNG